MKLEWNIPDWKNCLHRDWKDHQNSLIGNAMWASHEGMDDGVVKGNEEGDMGKNTCTSTTTIRIG